MTTPTAPTGVPQVTARHAWYAVCLLSLASMIGYLDRSLLTMLVAPVRADLGISGTQMSLLLGFAFAVFMGIASLPIAWFADRHDRVRILAAGILLWSLMTGLGAFADSYGMLFAARIGVGIGEAVLVPVGASLIADLFPRDQLGRANAVVMLGTASGAGLALVVGGAVIQWVTETGIHSVGLLEGFRGWQAAFLLAALPGIPLGLLVLLTVRDPRPRRAAVPAQASPSLGEPRWAEFVRMHRRTIITLCLAYPLASAATNGWLAWTPTFLMQKFGLGVAETGRIFGGLILVCGVIGVPLGGILTDRLFRRGGGGTAIRLSVAACLTIALVGAVVPSVGSLAVVVALMCVFFFTLNLIVVMPILAIQLLTPPGLRARMVAMLIFLTTLVGGGLGPTFIAMISEGVFGSMDALGRALAVASLTFGPISAALLFSVRRPFARSLAMQGA